MDHSEYLSPHVRCGWAYNRAMRKAIIALTATLLGLLALIYGALQIRSAPPVDDAWLLKGRESVPVGAFTVRFTGTTTLLFSDGVTSWMVDGWFSRPSLFEVLRGKIAPDLEAIEFGLAQNQVESLAAVIPVHSHYDHAMDAPEVARRTGAVLMGSESTANIGRGWQLPAEQIAVLEDRKPVQLGDFTITPIESRHFEFADAELRAELIEGDQRIAEPLVPPVRLQDYRLGKAYVLHIDHPKGSVAVVGSAGFVPDGLAGFNADVVFLGVGGLASQSEAYRESYWRETVDLLQPSLVVPVHYDSLTAPIEGDIPGTDWLLSIVSGERAETTLEFLRAKGRANPDVSFGVMPRYEQVILF